ncbi:MAG: hypothetical protein VW338_00925 [Rhodospirillaceae bacterium]
MPAPGVDAGEDARLTATRLARAFAEANGRIRCARDWYAGVRADFAN